MILKLLAQILKKEYRFLNRVELSKTNLLHNFKYLGSLNSGLKVVPVLKSNAYGHGLVEIAQILDYVKAPFFCVDSLHEAYRLLKTGVKTPILIMGYFDPENLKVKKLPFHYALFDLETAEIINKFQPQAKVHIKVDTGMHRIGIPIEELDQFCQELKQFENIKVEGLMSHLAQANNTSEKGFLSQVENFKKAKQILEQNGFNLSWTHIGASNALLNQEARIVIGKISNLVRAGKALYGLDPINQHSKLKPVLKFTTKIAQIKKIKAGSRVGYDWTFEAKQDLLLGILPAGYNDGVDRRLSNIGSVLIGGVSCPIVGRVSMNITTVDISNVPDPYIGQEVIIYSDNPKDLNSIENSAKLTGTIAHELLIHIDPFTKRIIT
ncbi:MAG: alanine racemase [Candidatus Daviesbacteria bacterium]|nr:alanine racemase [Candidatus Daviesbacteria bacterium]